jgi:hypothetical protein
MGQGEERVEELEVLMLPDGDRFRLVAPRFLDVTLDAASEADGQGDPPPTGRMRRFGRAVKRGYRALTRKRSLREDLLRELGEESRLVVRYPSALGVEAAREALQKLLERFRRKHRRWLIANGALLPLGAVLTLVPGPNVFVAYLGWRALTHHRAGRGSRAALASEEIRFEADEVLDQLAAVRRRRFRPGRRRKTRDLGLQLGVPDLDRLY